MAKNQQVLAIDHPEKSRLEVNFEPRFFGVLEGKTMKIKRGDTFAFYANFKDSAGSPIAYENIACQIRKRDGTLLANLTITPTETTGRYLFTGGATDTWPVGVLESDIQVVVGDKTTSSETFRIEVIKDITRVE